MATDFSSQSNLVQDIRKQVPTTSVCTCKDIWQTVLLFLPLYVYTAIIMQIYSEKPALVSESSVMTMSLGLRVWMEVLVTANVTVCRFEYTAFKGQKLTIKTNNYKMCRRFSPWPQATTELNSIITITLTCKFIHL